MKSKSVSTGGALWVVAALCVISAVISVLVHDNSRAAITIGVVGLVFALIAVAKNQKEKSAS